MSDRYKKQVDATKRNQGEDFYTKIGAKGGSAQATKPKGFAAMSPEKRRAAAQKGGQHAS